MAQVFKERVLGPNHINNSLYRNPESSSYLYLDPEGLTYRAVGRCARTGATGFRAAPGGTPLTAVATRQHHLSGLNDPEKVCGPYTFLGLQRDMVCGLFFGLHVVRKAHLPEPESLLLQTCKLYNCYQHPKKALPRYLKSRLMNSTSTPPTTRLRI